MRVGMSVVVAVGVSVPMIAAVTVIMVVRVSVAMAVPMTVPMPMRMTMITIMMLLFFPNLRMTLHYSFEFAGRSFTNVFYVSEFIGDWLCLG